jgi:hypothetical protein
MTTFESPSLPTRKVEVIKSLSTERSIKVTIYDPSFSVNCYSSPANVQTHTLRQGNGRFSLIGTVYITNTKAIMLAHPTQVQSVEYHGTP